MWQNARSNEHIGENQQRQDHECADPHGPGKADFGNQLVHHDREDDSAEGAATCSYAERKRSFLEEPRRNAVERRIEDHRRPDGTAYAL